MNVNNGLKISPFKEASKNNEDTELLYLTKYLLLISKNEPDFSKLNHSVSVENLDVLTRRNGRNIQLASYGRSKQIL